MPIQPALNTACRTLFQRHECVFHLAGIYLVLWASTGFQGLRQNIAPFLLRQLHHQCTTGFSSMEEQDTTQIALSLNRKIQIKRHGERIGHSGDNGGVLTEALVESIVPHPEYLTYWILRLSIPHLGYAILEQTERLERILELIANHY